MPSTLNEFLEKALKDEKINERKKMFTPEYIDYEIRALGGSLKYAADLFTTANYKEILKTLDEVKKDLPKIEAVVKNMEKVHKKRT